MDQYHILHDDWRDKGTFSLEQIEQMLDSGAIVPEQEVQRLGDKKTVSADYAKIFYQEDEDASQDDNKGRSFKMIFGLAMVIIGVTVGILTYQAFRSGTQVNRRQIVVAVVLTLAGAKIFQGNLPPKMEESSEG